MAKAKKLKKPNFIQKQAQKMVVKLFTNNVKSDCRKAIKEKRLVFLTNKKVVYINKEGKKIEYKLEEMAGVYITEAGVAGMMVMGNIEMEDVQKVFDEL
jgi:hypothetical protein